MSLQNATDLFSRQRHMAAYGDAVSMAFNITPISLIVGRILRMGIIPGGVEVHTIILANADLDSNVSPAVLFRMGFTPVDSFGPVADDDYFAAAGDTAFQSLNLSKMYTRFAGGPAIKFESDVFLDITINTAAATYAPGRVDAVVLGRCAGIR